MTERIYTAALLIIGNEILSGRTPEANLNYLAKWLNVQGIRLKHARVVPDEQSAIVEAVRDIHPKFDYLFTTGGIGATHDDITVEALAEALNVPIVIHPKARAILENYYGDQLNDQHLRMARVPKGAELIHNHRTGAPGIRWKNIFILAGVPKILQSMTHALDGVLEGGLPLLSCTIGAHVAESRVAGLLESIEKAYEGVQVGSYPFWRQGVSGANFVIRSTDPNQLNRASQALMVGLSEMGIEGHEGEI